MRKRSCLRVPIIMEWDCFLAWLLIVVHFGRVSLLTMITEGEEYILNRGDLLLLECDFHADNYNLFDYPVLWRKFQLNEERQVNIMGNINQPFVSSNRFEVAFTATAPRFRLELSLMGITLQDSGNYTCEVRGPQSLILGRVTHKVFVRAPVESLAISVENDTNSPSTSTTWNPYNDGKTPVTLTENKPVTIRCVAHGGYPPPKMELLVGRTDVTDSFRLVSHAKLAGDKGLRLMHYVTERWTNSFTVSSSDDGRKLKCLARVPGLKSNASFVKLNVLYSPKITCYDAGAYAEERNVHVRCEVRAKPQVKAIFWIIDVNGTTLSPGEVINEYWTLRMTRSDGVEEAQLFLRQTKLTSFRKYTLVAENNVAMSTQEVELYQKFKATSKQPLADDSKRRPSKSSRDREKERQQTGYSHVVHSKGSCTRPKLWAALVYMVISVSLISYR